MVLENKRCPGAILYGDHLREKYAKKVTSIIYKCVHIIIIVLSGDKIQG